MFWEMQAGEDYEAEKGGPAGYVYPDHDDACPCGDCRTIRALEEKR